MTDKALMRFRNLFNSGTLSAISRVKRRVISHLLSLLLAVPALAQTAAQPQVTVTLDPDGPVTVGTPVEVTATVLVPTWMPDPPVWPDLQIADAITRLPERATHPVSVRVGRESWSGLARTWRIIPQRAADYVLGPAQIAVTYADPETSRPVAATLDLPDIAFSAALPPGAEGMDPFLAATSLTVAAEIDGLSQTPQPGDSFTLTLTTTAAGPPAMLLPPLAERLPTPAGLRAYPRQPALADQPGDPPTGTRTEAIAYVIEQPGSYAFPALSLDWWNTARQRRETAATDAIAVDVSPPPGWTPVPGPRRLPRLAWLLVPAIAAALLAAFAALRHRGHPRPPSLRSRRRALRQAVRSGSPGAIRLRLAAWQDALPAPVPHPAAEEIETALRGLERACFGPAASPGSESASRQALLRAIDAARPAGIRPSIAALPALNPR
jgi:hypothetical protein